MKIDIEEVESALLEKKFDPVKVSEVIKTLEKVAEEIKADNKANAMPKQNWEHIIILNDKDGLLKNKEMSGWVVQQEAEADAGLVLSKLIDAAKTQNEAAKRKKNVIKDFVALFESLKPKVAKEKKVRVKTKELVRVLLTDGEFV